MELNNASDEKIFVDITTWADVERLCKLGATRQCRVCPFCVALDAVIDPSAPDEGQPPEKDIVGMCIYGEKPVLLMWPLRAETCGKIKYFRRSLEFHNLE